MTETSRGQLRRYGQRYEICVGGHLGETIRCASPDLRAQAAGGNTVLSGVLADQAALFGVIAQIEELGLVLVEVRRLPTTWPGSDLGDAAV
jgi:hypothetical protein